MDCCILSAKEVGRLKNYGLEPNHREHLHVSPKDAIDGVLDDVYEIVEHEGRQYVTRTKMYFLQRRRSGPLDTIQRVLSNQLVELKPIR